MNNDVKKAIKRTKRVEIALSEQEYAELLERKTKARLAEWIRETALGEKPKRSPKPVNPHLLYELNRIGSNINQIAKMCNIQQANIDLLRVSLALKEIEIELQKITDNFL